MNCQSFESLVNDLARDQMMEAEARQRALSHTVGCERCRLRLADERALTAGLRKLAENREEAPARVEASLRDAFAVRIAASREPVVAAVPARSRWLSWAGAAAAILLVALLALTVIRSRPTETRDLQEQLSLDKQAQPSGAPLPAGPRAEPAPSELAVAEKIGPRAQPRANGPRNGRRGGQRRERTPKVNPPGTLDTGTEIATEFIPLVHGGDVAIPDGGHIMRVELPRSALVSFGLPMNMERAGEPVRADVVVGNDGLARAIRFVR
jgi:hypothetical protein